MSPHQLHDIANIILAATLEPYETIWLYCQILGASPAISCYIQRSAQPQRVYNHLPVFERTGELRQNIRASREADEREGKKPWSTMTILLRRNGEQVVEYSFEDMERTDTFKLRQSWKAKHLGALEFVPDKR